MANVDVVIPVRDGEATIGATLDAVLNQSVSDVLIWVVDDGSDDGTRDVVTAHSDHRVILVDQEPAGPAAARNTGATMGSAPWIAFLDADQEPDTEWLAGLLIDPGAGVVGCAGRFIETDGTVEIRQAGRKTGGGPIYQPGHFLVRRAIFDAAGRYDPELRYSENTELGFRVKQVLAERDLAEVTVTDPLVTTRMPESGPSRQFSWERRLASAELIISKHEGTLPRRQIAQYHAIAGVAARNVGAIDVSKRHFVHAIRRRPLRLRYWAGLGRSLRTARG